MSDLQLVYRRANVRVESGIDDGYLVREGPGRKTSITCLVCGFTSANRNDVDERYCARCRRFHEAPQLERSR